MLLIFHFYDHEVQQGMRFIYTVGARALYMALVKAELIWHEIPFQLLLIYNTVRPPLFICKKA